MRNFRQKLLNASLAALYSGIALLGYGLHELAPHHHHHPAAQAQSHAGCTHAHHHHAPLPETPGFSDSHECEVCAFLEQLQSDRPQLAAEVTWQPTFSAAVAVIPQVHTITSLGPAAPRGPPAFIG